jgi:predicted naringenin-chalcone synthase
MRDIVSAPSSAGWAGRRFINAIFTVPLGRVVDNATLLSAYEARIERLGLERAADEALRRMVRFWLVGDRTRHMFVPDVDSVSDFESRARLFEAGAGVAVEALGSQVERMAEAGRITFDAVLTTTSTGNLMPGLSYRLARRLGGLVRRDSLLVDLGNVGCTGSAKALALARALDAAYRHVLVVAVELPTTLLETRTARPDVWQGNCTFGDGAVAMVVSAAPDLGDMGLALEDLRYHQQADSGFDLIHWAYGRYYTFALADEKRFDREVAQCVIDAIGADPSAAGEGEQRWAVHPAGVLLLLRLRKKLGVTVEALAPSVQHYRRYSNMSSASLPFVLADVAAGTPRGATINLLTMGAGFNVMHGRVRRES